MTNQAVTETIEVDLCVVGAAGLPAAMAAAAFGAPVALVAEVDGGVPALAISALAAAARIEQGDVPAASADSRWLAARDRVQQACAAAAPNRSLARAEAIGVRVTRAVGRFVDGKTLDAGGRLIRARRFIIAAGASPLLPPIPGLTPDQTYTPETITNVPEPPAHLIIIGAGSTGLALGQSIVRFGARVTVIEAGRALRREDPEIARIVLERLAADGVVVRERKTIERVVGAPGDIRVALVGGEQIHCTHLLLAAGRRPRIQTLQLDRAGVAHDASGIIVDRHLRTSNRRIYAIGDCIAGYPYAANSAQHHAGLVMRAILFRLPAKIDAPSVPRVTFTDPEIAACGISEAEARAVRKDVVTLRWPFAENETARARDCVEGHVKLVATKSGRILGVAIVGRGASEILPLWTLAIAKRLKVGDIAGVMFPSPTLSQVSQNVAASFLAPVSRNPLARRLAALLRSFG
ncbi:MAG: NAD(P)/FAD-dependent oxidoreductase [Beijerinckiaceae bacterium]